MATLPPEGWFTGPAGMTPGQAEVGIEDSPWYLPGTGPATFTSGEGQDQTVGSRGPESIPQDMAWRQTGDQKYQVQQFGPDGLIGTASEVNTKDPNDAIFKLLIQAGMAGVLGPLAGTLGGAVNTGLGLGLGKVGATALGTALVSAGKTAGGGGDFGDVAKAGLTSGATSYLGSLVGDYLPKDLAPTGIKTLDTALNKGLQSAAGSGVTSLLTGNKNILQDALTAGAGAAAGSGVNSLVSDAVGSTGLPPSALNILGPAAIASLTGGDGTTAALKAAIGELGGAIKGSSAEGKQTGPGVAVTRDLMSGITEPGEYPQDDGSVLAVSRLEKGPNKGKLVGNVFSKEDVLKEAYQDWSKQPAYAPLSDDADTFYSGPSVPSDDQELNQIYKDAGLLTAPATEQLSTDAAPTVEITGQTPSDYGLDFGAFAERPEASLDAAPQKVEVTGRTSDIELMRFLEANGLTADEAQKVLEGTPTPKVVVQGEAQPKNTTTDDLMALLNQYDPKLDNGQQAPNRVEITEKKLLEDMGLDLGAYNEGPVVAPDKLTDLVTQTVPITGTKVKDELDPNFFYQPDEVSPDKLTDDITRLVEIIGQTPNTPLDYSSLETVPDKLTDDITQEVEIIGQTPPKEFPFIYPGEEPPPEVNEPVVEPIKPVVKPVVKPVIPKVPVVTPPRTTTTPSYTIPGTTTQLHQELMQLPEMDISRLLNPALYAYKDAQKRKTPSGNDRMMALLNELGYRS